MSGPAASGSLRLRPPTWVLWLAALLLNLAAMPLCQVEGDGLKETGLAIDARGPARPQHLWHSALYHAAIVLGQRLEPARGDCPPTVRPATFLPVQVLNGLCGATATIQVRSLLLALDASPGAALTVAAGFALSQTPWVHSRTGDTAMTPLPCALGALLLLLRPAARRRDRRLRAAAAGLLLAVGGLLCLNVVFLAPALALAAWRPRPDEERDGLAVVTFGAALLLLLGAAYARAAAAAGLTGPGQFVGWLTTHEDTKGLALLQHSLVGTLRNLAGLGRLLFPLSEGETAFKAALRGQQVAITPLAWLTFVRNLAATAALAGLALAGWWRARRTAAGAWGGVALAVTGVFNLLWFGSDPQYWLPVYPVLLAFAMRPCGAWAATPARVRAGRWLVGAGLLLLAALNLPGGTPALLWPRWSPDWERVRAVEAATGVATTVVVPGRSPLRYLRPVLPAPCTGPTRQVIDLTYDAPQELEGAAFLAWLDARLHDLLATREVYVEGLREPLPPTLLGGWDMVAGTHRVTRAEVAAYLDEQFEVRPATHLPAHLSQVRPRRAAGR